MNNKDTLNSNLELEKKFYKLQTDYENLESQNIKLQKELHTLKQFKNFIKSELSQILPTLDKANKVREEAYRKSNSHGKSGESHYYYTPVEVPETHIELKKICIEFVDKLSKHLLIR